MLSTGAYANGGDATAQYGMFDIDGTGYDINNTTPLWSAMRSGDWATSSNWTYGAPNAGDATANFDEGITANSIVTLSSAQTVGTVNFDNPLFKFSLAGTSSLTLSASSGPAFINSWAGSHAITAPIVYTAGLTVTTFADPSIGSPSLTFPLNITATGTLIKSGTGTLKFAASTSGISTLNLPGLTIATGTVALASNSLNSVRTLLITSALSITGGSLDLGNNDLDITSAGSAGLTNINSYVATGSNGGSWNGSGGINSSAAASNTRHLTALGVILNSVDGTAGGAALYGASTSLGLFDGTSPSNTDVLVKYTYYGDANLDGKVGGSDYSKIDSGYLRHLTGWLNGDFNYDGVINGSDYTLIDNAFNTQGARLSSQLASLNAIPTAQIAVAAETTSVPEPMSMGLTGCFSSALLARRRRRSDVAVIRR